MQEYAENVLIPDVESVVDEYPLNRKDQKVLLMNILLTVRIRKCC